MATFRDVEPFNCMDEWRPRDVRLGHSQAGQTTLCLTPMHGKVSILQSLIANIRAALQHVGVAAKQFKTTDPWAVLMRYLSDMIAPTLEPFRHPDALPATGQLPDIGSIDNRRPP